MAKTRSAKHRGSYVLLFAVLGGLSLGCSMDPKECAKRREASFDLINTPNYCKTDADCKASEWPGCPKPINQTTLDKLRETMLACKKGKCEEHPLRCDPPPAVYCQEGLCTFRYKPSPDAPPPGMIVE